MLYVGIIEDRNDPLQLGRVRVRVYGLHTDDKTQIPTNDLPWAQVIHPTTSSANSGVSETPNMVEGSTVIVMYTDADDMQQPIILGTLAGNIKSHYKVDNGVEVARNKDAGFNDPNGVYPKEEYIDESDLNKLSRDNPTTPHTLIEERATRERDVSSGSLGGVTWSEPETGVGKHQYPFNKVTETESGHIIEIDDTPSNERIHIRHKSGSFIEILPNGDILTKGANDNFEIINRNNNVLIKGNCNLTVNGDCNTNVSGNYNLNVGGTTDIDSSGNVTIKAPKIDLNP